VKHLFTFLDWFPEPDYTVKRDMKTETVPKELKQVTEIIKQKADPVRIVLFGSRARGDNTATSDYDILVVTKKVENEREITRKIYKELYTQGVDLDIELTAVDENRWNNVKERFDLIYRNIDSEGIEIYSE